MLTKKIVFFMTMKILKHDANVNILIKKTKFLRKKSPYMVYRLQWCCVSHLIEKEAGIF